MPCKCGSGNDIDGAQIDQKVIDEEDYDDDDDHDCDKNKNDDDVENDYGDSNDAAETWCSELQIDQKVIVLFIVKAQANIRTVVVSSSD